MSDLKPNLSTKKRKFKTPTLRKITQAVFVNQIKD